MSDNTDRKPIVTSDHVGYHPKCIICNSEFRADAERLYIEYEGSQYRVIAKYLRDTYGANISHEAVRRHMKKHFPIKEESARRYAEQSAIVLQEAIEKRLSDIQMLDEIAIQDYTLRKTTTQWLIELMQQREKDGKVIIPKLPMGLVTVHNAAASELRQNRKTKAELLGDDPNGSSLDLGKVLEEVWKNRNKSDDEEDDEDE